MRFLAVADVHLTELFSSQVKKQIEESFLHAVQLCRENHCPTMKILGDVIHDKTLLYIQSIRFLSEVITKNPDIHFEFIVGNHDCLGDPLSHGFMMLSREENVTVIDRPRQVTDESGNTLLDLPYSKTVHKQLPELSADYLFSHFGVNEAMVSPGISAPHRVRFADLLQFRKIFLGHYHLPQEHTFGDSWLTYVGSVAAKDWSDKNQLKRAYIIDTVEGTEESILLPNNLQFIELSAETKDELTEALAKKELLRADGHKVRIRAAQNFGIEDSSVICSEAAPSQEYLNVSAMSPSALAEAWITLQHESSAQLEKESLLEVGNSILKLASERSLQSKETKESCTSDDS